MKLDELAGLSLIAERQGASTGELFRAHDPATGKSLEPAFHTATLDEVEQAAAAAEAAAPILARLDGNQRAILLRAIADTLTEAGPALINRAHVETGLPLPRLQGELARTTGQLKLFADVVDEGSWVDARIDEALPDRKPLPRSDIRSMLRPIGPVVVFGASNFPLAFSVAGGDTASALAAGNPIIVKAHPAHPGTSEIAGRAIQQAIHAQGLPAGTFSLLFDAGIEIGRALVQHPLVKAVAFTGSSAAGQALMQLAARRPEPIPCFTEMGSTNPLFILPGAMRDRAAALAQGLQTSFTLGSGQFCTKPGLVFVPDSGNAEFLQTLSTGVESLAPQTMLTTGIAGRYAAAIEELSGEGVTSFVSTAQSQPESPSATGSPNVFSVKLNEFLANHKLEEEVFGPTTLLIHYGKPKDLVAVAQRLHGHLTATLHGTEDDLSNAAELIAVLERKAGRILVNGYPTGVEVCHAMVHGGPFPATSDSRFTSVGTRAMLRFARPVCYQDFPDAALPPELQRSNPNGILRMINGSLTRS
ncbi:MAG TPA: aldehyde dehydrogenase (NADP(+)) [Edaphobacter sp.]